MSTIVSIYYLAKYKYFTFIFSLKYQILYLADFINNHRPFGLAQTPNVFYILLDKVIFQFIFLNCLGLTPALLLKTLLKC